MSRVMSSGTLGGGFRILAFAFPPGAMYTISPVAEDGESYREEDKRDLTKEVLALLAECERLENGCMRLDYGLLEVLAENVVLKRRVETLDESVRTDRELLTDDQLLEYVNQRKLLEESGEEVISVAEYLACRLQDALERIATVPPKPTTGP